MVDVYFFDDVMATRVSVLLNGTTITRGIFHLPEKKTKQALMRLDPKYHKCV